MLKFGVPANLARQAYTREDVCRMLGISGAQLRGWQRQGFLPSSGDFTFADLIAVKTLLKLRQNRVSPRKISRALSALKRKLSGVERPLSELRILSDGNTVTVQIAGQKMEAVTGQLLFDFDTAGLGSVTTLPDKPAETAAEGAARQAHAEHWFQRGLALEETGAPIEQAVEAYRRAAELNPNAAGALLNLGTIHYHMHKFREAESNYLAAIAADPKYPLAHFNLGNLYDERGETAHAREQYEIALRLDPSYADAHYNLALLCEKAGDFLKAQHHWRAYLKLDPASSWAQVARKQLEKLRQATIIHGTGK
jgi:tetratricopeptide (TPR) repeat protein